MSYTNFGVIKRQETQRKSKKQAKGGEKQTQKKSKKRSKSGEQQTEIKSLKQKKGGKKKTEIKSMNQKEGGEKQTQIKSMKLTAQEQNVKIRKRKVGVHSNAWVKDRKWLDFPFKHRKTPVIFVYEN